MSKLKLSLNFSRIECERCAADRVLGMKCAECGSLPRKGEVNSPVVRRRQLTSEVDAAIERASASKNMLNVEDAEPAVRSSLKSLLSGLNRLRAPGTSARGIADISWAVSSLNQAVATLRDASSLRPAARARTYLKVGLDLQRLWPLYREALTTLDIAQAQRKAVEAQAVIDTSARHLHALAADMDATSEFATVERGESFALQVFRGLSSRHPGLDIPALVELGGREYSDQTGKEAGTGASLDYLIVQLVARTYLDPVALSEKLAEISAVAPPRTRVLAVSQMRESLRDFGVSRRDVFEALHQFHLLANSEMDPAAMFRRLAKTVGELYEAALPIFAWARLLLSEQADLESYLRLARDDSTAMTTWLQGPLPKTAKDLPKYLRHAGHHGRSFEVDVVGGTVTIQLRSHTERMTLSEYVDKVYALLESVLAVQWSIANWLELSGVDVPMDTGLAAAVGLTPDVLIRLWLEEGRQLTVRKSQVNGRLWQIVADFDKDHVLSTAFVAAQQCGDICDVVEVLTTGASEPNWHLNLTDYEKAMEASPAGGAGAVVRLCQFRHAILQSGTCLLTQDDLEFAAIAIGGSVLNGALEHIPLLREVRVLAKLHGAVAAETLAVRAIRASRDGNEGEVLRENAERLKYLSPPAVPTPRNISVYVRSDHTGPHN